MEEYEDIFAEKSFASALGSTTASIHSYSTLASATKNEIIFQEDGAKKECSKSNNGKGDYSLKKYDEVNNVFMKSKPWPTTSVRIAPSINDTLMKKRQFSHRKRIQSSTVHKSKARNVDTDKTPVMSRNNRNIPSNNLFMQMGDDEVGNHNSSESHTEATEPTASTSSGPKNTDFARWDDEGLILFQSHAHAGDDVAYYLTPSRGKTGPNNSPQSVLEGVETNISSETLMEGVGSSISSKDLALISFPRYSIKSGNNVRRSSANYPNPHGSSCDDSDSVAHDGDAGDIDDASVGTSITKTISDSLPPVLKTLQAFIIGTPCWTPGTQSVFIDGLSSTCAKGARCHAARDCNDDEDEEHSVTSNDDNDTSFYSSEDSSRGGVSYGDARKKKTIAAKHKAKKSVASRKGSSRRRGRSPTIKEGYNSDGESLRSRSRGSRASTLRRGSFSFSVDSSGGYETSQSCGNDSQISEFSEPREMPIKKRGGAGGASFGVVVGSGGRGCMAFSNCFNDIHGNTGDNKRYGHPSDTGTNAIGSVVDENTSSLAARDSAVDANGHSIISSESIVCSSSIVAAENIMSYDQAMWLSMTQEKLSLNGMVDTRDKSNSRIAGCANSESSLEDGSVVIIPKEAMLPRAMLDLSDCLVQKTAFPVPNVSDIKSKKTAWMKQARERRTRMLKSKANATR